MAATPAGPPLAPAPTETASAACVRRADRALELLTTVRATLHEHEHEGELGRLDAIARDGDHGVGMRRGIDAAHAAAGTARGSGLSSALRAAGEGWSEVAGGTSCALWGAALDTVVRLGRAQVGDKTLVDALVPSVERLEAAASAGPPPPGSLVVAAEEAIVAAAETSVLRPALGRARPLADRSLGHPDAGATSLALVLSTIARAAGGT